MIKKLFYLFVFFAPFTSFFALTAWLRLPVVINQLLIIALLIGVFKYNKIKNKFLQNEDQFLLIFLAFVWLSFLLGFLEKRSFNHTLAYTNAILFFFFISKYVIDLFTISSIKIAKMIYWSFLTASVIILIDFIGKNYFNFSLRDVFTHVDGKISNMDYYIRFGFLRVGGVAEEPGNMALFYNIYFGISLYYLHQKMYFKKFKWLILLFIACHFALLSNAGIVLPIIAGIIIFAMNRLRKMKISNKQLFITLSLITFVVIAAVLIWFFDVGHISDMVQKFLNKVFFNESEKAYSSSGQRLKQWGRAFQNFKLHPIFGNGPGFGVNEDPEGYLSVYLTILSDIGSVALLLFFSFQGALIRKVMKLNVHIRGFLLFSVITSFLHLLIVADFYNAPLWILFAFIQLVYREQKNKAL